MKVYHLSKQQPVSVRSTGIKGSEDNHSINCKVSTT